MIQFGFLDSNSTPLNSQINSQLAFTCSKSTLETLEKGVKYIQSWQYTRMMSLASFWCFHYKLWTYFNIFLVFLLLTLNK